MSNENIYYNYNKLRSHDGFFNIVIGSRGYGKTYGMKKICIDNFLKKGQQFVYVRRFKTQIKEVLDDNSFLKDIIHLYEGHEFVIKGKKLYIDGKVAGYFVALSTSQNLKSKPLPEVTTIFYDEFIPNSSFGYLPSEVHLFLELISSIARDRNNVKVYLVANNISYSNPYLSFFNIEMNDTQEFYKAQNGLVVVHKCEGQTFMEKMYNTKFGQLVKGTKYGDYAISNKSLNDNLSFIKFIPKKKCKGLFNIETTTNIIQISQVDEYLYCHRTIDESLQRYSLNIEVHDEDTVLIKNNSSIISQIKLSFQNKKLLFQNIQIKNEMLEFLK